MSVDEIFLFVAVFTCGYYNTMLYFLDGLKHYIICILYISYICLLSSTTEITTEFFNDNFVSKYSYILFVRY